MTDGKSKILMAHGSGGSATHRLIEEEFLPRFANDALAKLEDQAAFSADGVPLAVTTDAYVVSPIIFPGGTIGELAVNGTINDLAVGGYDPLLITMALIIEEGLAMDELRRVLDAASEASRAAGVPIVAGDTKVVGKGAADKLFIATTGVGRLSRHLKRGLSASAIAAGDKIILSGTIGDHGMAILTAREGLRFEGPLASDTAALHGLAEAMLSAGRDAVHAMRDPTRGGLATTLVEMAASSGVTMEIREESLPVNPAVRGACELLGLDPLYVANEGKLAAFVDPQAAEAVLAAAKSHPLGRNAVIIGQVLESSKGKVVLSTALGGRRLVHMLSGEQLPRIC